MDLRHGAAAATRTWLMNNWATGLGYMSSTSGPSNFLETGIVILHHQLLYLVIQGHIQYILRLE